MITDSNQTQHDVGGLGRLDRVKADLPPLQRADLGLMARRELTGLAQKGSSRSQVNSRGTDISGGLIYDTDGYERIAGGVEVLSTNLPPAEFSGLKASLVIASLGVARQWHEYIRSKAPELRPVMYCGDARERENTCEIFSDYHVVITTYRMLSLADEKSPLFTSEWYRIIADEAHIFRNTGTNVAKAILKLGGVARRWALTGTPVQNTAWDVVNLLEFVGIPIRRQLEAAFGKAAERHALGRELIRHALHEAMLPRKPASQVGQHGALKRETIIISPCPKQYQLMMINKLRLSYNIFVQKSSLRQVCDDPAILANKFRELSLSDSVCGLLETTENVQSTFPAGHESAGTIWGSKLEMIVQLVAREPEHKFVVFSSYVDMLQRLEDAFSTIERSCHYYTGAQRVKERSKVLNSFNSGEGADIVLCTLHTKPGDFSAASRVILVEPWWNPVIVDQAVESLCRRKKNQPVIAYEMVFENSIETRIFSTCNLKRRFAQDLLRQPLKTEEGS